MATCFGIMMDKTNDSGHIEQVLVVMYVDVAFVIQERFMNVEHTESILPYLYLWVKSKVIHQMIVYLQRHVDSGIRCSSLNF